MTDKPTLDSIRIPDTQYTIGLTRLTGLKIREVLGYLSQEFGDTIFKITALELEDGSLIGVEGEHDFPYLSTYARYPIPNMDEETLDRLYDEDNPDEDETE